LGKNWLNQFGKQLTTNWVGRIQWHAVERKHNYTLQGFGLLFAAKACLLFFFLEQKASLSSHHLSDF
jgi:hypothetical protein